MIIIILLMKVKVEVRHLELLESTSEVLSVLVWPLTHLLNTAALHEETCEAALRAKWGKDWELKPKLRYRNVGDDCYPLQSVSLLVRNSLDSQL
jgi:hypothetical protein